MVNKVVICGVNTATLPTLNNDRKTELFKRIKQGDEQAREEFINGNLRLVLSVVRKFTNRGEQIDDLFQIGCVGLIKAIDNFDLSHNVKFSTYAVPMNAPSRNTFLARTVILKNNLFYISFFAKEAYSDKLKACVYCHSCSDFCS